MSERNSELYEMQAEFCKTFSDPKRLMILNELRHGEKSVGDMVTSLDINQAVISRHLAILREKGVVTRRREGTTIYYSLADPKIGAACDLVHEILLKQIEKNREMTDRLMA